MLTRISFRIGDLVQLQREPSRSSNPFYVPIPNIYRIAYLNQEEVRLLWETNRYSLDEINPIPINGKDDARIRLLTPRHAPFVMEGMKQPQPEAHLAYYLDQIRQFGWDQLLQEIEQQRIKYVHQVQHYLAEHFGRCQLLIDLRQGQAQ